MLSGTEKKRSWIPIEGFGRAALRGGVVVDPQDGLTLHFPAIAPRSKFFSTPPVSSPTLLRTWRSLFAKYAICNVALRLKILAFSFLKERWVAMICTETAENLVATNSSLFDQEMTQDVSLPT